MFTIKNNRGFTLIELLIVIAIIGVLSGVVLASLNTARERGDVTAIKSNLVNLRSQGEILRTDNGDYNEVCGHNGATQDGRIAEAIAEAEDIANSSVICAVPSGGSTDARDWAIAIALPDGEFFCVDSSGAAETTTSSLTPGALTNANDLECN